MENIIDKVLQEINNEEIVILSNDKCNHGITIHTCINKKTNSITYIEIYSIHKPDEPLFILSISTVNPNIQIPFDIYQLVYKNRCKLALANVGIYILNNTIDIIGASNEIISYKNTNELWNIIRNYLNALILQESV